MNVLLISANTHIHPYPAYPLGLDYVAGALADRHQVQIVDMNAQGAGDALFDVIEGYAPDVIGFSVRNIDNSDSTHPQGYLSEYRVLIDAIRTRTSSPLVLGGSGFTIFPEELMRALGADYGVIGEGERMSVLLDALEGRKDGAPIPGIVTRHSPAVIPPPMGAPDREKVRPIPAPCQVLSRKGGDDESPDKAGVQLPLHLLHLSSYRRTNPSAFRTGRGGPDGAAVAGGWRQIFFRDGLRLQFK